MTISHQQLRLFTPFDTLIPEYLDKVLEKTSKREVSKGTIIFKRGKDLPEALYLISGQVDLIDAQFVITSIDEKSESRRSALNTITPTQVSALAKSPVELLVIERDFLDLVMAWSESGDDQRAADEEESDWMSSLLQAPLFSKIPPGNIRQLFTRFSEQKVAADEIVIREGERGEYFYVLEGGSATVLDTAGHILAALRPGDFFGEEALAGETTRNATIKMITAGKLRRLQKEDFKALLLEPVLHYVTMEELQKRAQDLPPFLLLDVRLPVERRFRLLAGSRNIPLSQLRKSLAELDQKVMYVVTDDAGRRSDVAVQLLNQAGFDVCMLKNTDQHYAA
jgi:CRP-like cAMP-binding protein